MSRSSGVKSARPVARLASALNSTWGRDPGSLKLLTEEARRRHITVRPPDVNRSSARSVLRREGSEWIIVWGLALLPGWDTATAIRFIGLRPQKGFSSLRELCLAAVKASLSATQIATLIRAGACDHLGGIERNRGGLLAALDSAMDWAHNSYADQEQSQLDLFTMADGAEPPGEETYSYPSLTPRGLYAQRSWEEQNLGLAFTGAADIEMLRRALDSCGDLRTRLRTTAQIGPAHLGQSIYLVGLLTSLDLHTLSDNTKAGREAADDARIAVGWVEDLDGCVELVAFPPSYKRHIEHWTENNLVIITGRVSKHVDGEIYLLCEHLAPFYSSNNETEITLKVKGAHKPAAAPESVLQESSIIAKASTAQKAPQPQKAAAQTTKVPVATLETPPQPAVHPTYKLIITLPFSADDHADIDTMIALNRLLEQHPGEDIVTLRIPYLPEMGAVTSAQLPRGVRYSSALEARIRDLLGYDALATIKLIS